MKNVFKLAVVATMVVGALNAGAVAYQDVDYANSLNGSVFLSGSGNSVGGQFNIVGSDADAAVTIGAPYGAPTTYYDIGGFTPGSTLAGAEMYVYVRDAQNNGDYLMFYAPGAALLGGFSQSSVVFGVSLDVTAGLQANGTVNWTVASFNGDFYVDYVALVAGTTANDSLALSTARPAGVPDSGSTLWLLGIGFLGLAGVKRKLGI